MSAVIDEAPGVVLHWYDFVCPFCYVGQSRTALLMGTGLDVISLPLQAHPDIPDDGLLVGSRCGPERKLLEQQAAAAGLELRWPARIPNSRKALAAADWVRRNQPNVFAEVHYKLFEAHFAVGEDIGDQAVIDRHAANAGVDVGALHTALIDGSGYAGVDQAQRAGHQHGIHGTPAWLLGGRLIVGLQPVPKFQRMTRDALISRRHEKGVSDD